MYSSRLLLRGAGYQRSYLRSTLAKPASAFVRWVGTNSLPETLRRATPHYYYPQIGSRSSSLQSKPSLSFHRRNSKRATSHIPCSVHTEITSPTVTVDGVHDPTTGTWQYVVADPHTLKAVVIDPVLDYDGATQTIRTETADRLISLIQAKGYEISRILETHAHADHLTAASYLQSVFVRDQGCRPPICIGRRIREIQQLFRQRYNVPANELSSAFDQLLEDDDVFQIGRLQATVVHLPGHTPDHVGYMIGDNVFCGDSLFNADLGTARCDFPGGSAKALYQSTRKLLSLPNHYRIWTGHDYPSPDRQCPVPYMSVQDQKQRNRYLHDNVSEEIFQDMRYQRDAGLNEPKLLHASLQVNIRGGRLPNPSPEGQRYLTLPLRLKNDSQW